MFTVWLVLSLEFKKMLVGEGIYSQSRLIVQYQIAHYDISVNSYDISNQGLIEAIVLAISYAQAQLFILFTCI